MATTLRPIATRYRGCRMRSRIEARWAVLFDALGVTWEYEKEGFELGAAGRYLPDFWLPELKCWVEIKGDKPNASEMGKTKALAEQSQTVVHLFFGKVAHDPFWSSGIDDGSWGAYSAYPSCKCGRYKRGLHSRWTSWQICHACSSPYISDITMGCECRGDYLADHCETDRALRNVKPRCYLDATGRRRRCLHDEMLERAYLAGTGARFEHGESGARW